MTDKYKQKRLSKIQKKNRYRQKQLRRFVCSSSNMVTVHDETKRKISKL